MRAFFLKGGTTSHPHTALLLCSLLCSWTQAARRPHPIITAIAARHAPVIRAWARRSPHRVRRVLRGWTSGLPDVAEMVAEGGAGGEDDHK